MAKEDLTGSALEFPVTAVDGPDSPMSGNCQGVCETLTCQTCPACVTSCKVCVTDACQCCILWV
jgi:hypothetical protein